MITEYLEEGKLIHKVCQTPQIYTETFIAQTIRQIVNGIMFSNQKDLFHNNITLSSL